MVTLRHGYLALLGVLAVERLVELAISSRNARGLRARGAVEAGRAHYPPMVALHATFLAACAVAALARPAPPPAPFLVAVPALAAGQALRWWAMAALGPRWTTRVLVLPGAPPVTRGPYRYLRHPNYLAVVLEMAAVPLLWGSWGVALAFSTANAALLALRIRAEERALGDGWARAFRGRPRLLPGGGRDAA